VDQYYEELQERRRTGEHQRQAEAADLSRTRMPRLSLVSLLTPDVYRADLFKKELKSYEQKGVMPNLIYLTAAPVTHGQAPILTIRRRGPGGRTDLAPDESLRRSVNSKFWPDTCIFVARGPIRNDGFDHVDAPGRVALAIRPLHEKPANSSDHTNYNQTGMVKNYRIDSGPAPYEPASTSRHRQMRKLLSRRWPT